MGFLMDKLFHLALQASLDSGDRNFGTGVAAHYLSEEKGNR